MFLSFFISSVEHLGHMLHAHHNLFSKFVSIAHCQICFYQYTNSAECKNSLVIFQIENAHNKAGWKCEISQKTKRKQMFIELIFSVFRLNFFTILTQL